MSEAEKELKRRVLQALMKAGLPSKRSTKKGSKASVSSFRKNLKGVPGGTLLDMSWAKETGTIEGKQITAEQSAKNSYTTKGNYIV